ncbi:ATPase [hydrothermal vent metagenome]|uniref:ATPase n=1 Tax=hydrothermal vent metagenome TaxID=652676 RepID=A0A3B0Y8U4_9ZZZZ
MRTYLERDVRQLIKVQDLGIFQRFLRLCAGEFAGQSRLIYGGENQQTRSGVNIMPWNKIESGLPV